MQKITDWTIDNLRAFAKENGIKTSGSKDELFERALPTINAKIEKRLADRKAEAEHEAKIEELRKAEAKLNFACHSDYYARVTTLIGKHRQNCEDTLQSFSKSIADNGVTWAIRHYGEQAMQAERQMKVWNVVARVMNNEEQTLQEKLEFFEESVEQVVDSFLDYGTIDRRDDAQVFTKAARSIKAYIKHGAMLIG